MAARKNSGHLNMIITRVICMMVVWVGFILFALSCVSFHASDPPSHMMASFTTPVYQNWCGGGGCVCGLSRDAGRWAKACGDCVVWNALAGIWTRGDKVPQLALRIIGTALLIAGVSTLFNLVGGSGPFGEGAGGMLGIGLGNFLEVEFKHGAWFLLIATFVVGGLLAADEFMLALPARLLWVGKKLPTEPVKAVATDAAGGVWGGIRGIFAALGSKGKMGKAGEDGKRKLPVEEVKSEGNGFYGRRILP